MLKKKPIYIAGIILFTLILILDVAIYLTAPKNAAGFDESGFGGMPQGGFTMPEGFDASQIPEGFNPSDMSGIMQPPQGNSLLASIRSAFVPILIVVIIGDVVCAVMLVVIAKKNKSEEPETVEQAHIDYNLPL